MGLYALAGRSVAGCLGAFSGMLFGMTLSVAGQHEGLARRVLAREAGVPEAELPPFPAGLPIRVLLTLPLFVGVGLVLGG
ncbi:hypothetical protein ACFV1A_09210 [Streptomyces seoulensis]|uniref:hypothetical protein n=1 Tax=Streptomyces seoulensis TaxID=73044 RepID=UPI003678973E